VVASSPPYNTSMLAPGSSLGPYRLIGMIGAGGMGEVWKGEDTRLGRMVAIKILPQNVAENAESRARLQREARTAAHLYHPNIATIHSIEQEGDRLFIVMQFVEGEPLTKRIRRGPMAEGEVCRIGKGVADALAEAHSQQIVHRDIKPDNIMVSGDRVKVLDFGIAKQVGGPAGTQDDPTAFVTQQGLIIGTVHYMSPEQALGKPLDSRTDLFSLGVVLYEAVTGRLPFRGETVTETITQIVRDQPPEAAALNPAVSPEMNEIIARCMRKNRDDRFASASELAAALDRRLDFVTTAPATAAQGSVTESSLPVAVTATEITGAPTAIRPPAATAPAAPTVVERATLPPSSKSWVWAGMAVLLATMIFATVVVVRGRNVGDTPRPAAVATTASAAQPAPASSTVDVSAPGTTTAAASATTTVSSPATVETQTNPPAAAAPPAAERAPVTPIAPPSGSHAPLVGVVIGGDDVDDLYQTAVQIMRNGSPQEARQLFLGVLATDPHYARASFRLGEMALLNRAMKLAAPGFARALADADRLDYRERQLATLGLAISSGERFRVRELASAFEQRYPADPDLAAWKRVFPGLLGEGGERPRRFRRK
jgi:eukaryotic-like serine/threonine-protein kinase